MVGFIDGDGCLSALKHVDSRRGGCVSYEFLISVGQAHSLKNPPETLKRIQHWYGGRWSTVASKGQQRQKWYLTIPPTQKQNSLLLEIKKYGIIKAPQAIVMLNVLNGRINKAEGKQRLHQLKKEYAKVVIDERKLTPAYISGLFDAEGYVGISRGDAAELRLSQKSCPALLNAIANKWG